MAYRVFLSSNDEAYLAVAKTALWNMGELAFSVVSAADIGQSAGERLTHTKQAMETTQLFLGIYGASYGDVAEGESQSYAEQEYHLAMQRGIMCVVFLEAACKTSADERMTEFIALLERQHVIAYFDDEQDLSAQIVLAVNKFPITNRQMRLRPPLQTFAPRSREAHQEAGDDALNNLPVERSGAPVAAKPFTPPTERAAPTPASVPPLDIPVLVEQALAVASDDIEQIVRRALQVHDAQKQMATHGVPTGEMRVNPIFGAPSQSAQFQADVFMIMPFRDVYNGVYHNIIRPVVGSLNLTIKRGDEFASPQGLIMAEVWAALNACKLVIVETTEVNANVYYELGIAHTLGKPAILLTQQKEIEQIPFDIRHLRFIVYENTIAGGEKLEQDLRKTIIWLMNDLGDIK